MKQFFTADPHFFHKNVIEYCNRPFKDVEEMNRTLIDNWNSVVGNDDIVYVIGDFALGTHKVEEVITSLNGNIHLIIGSHEKVALRSKKLFYNVSYKHTTRIGDQLVFLDHYCHKVWDRSHYGSWHLFGHSHGKLDEYSRKEGKLLDVGVDQHNYFPWSEEEVIELMETRPLNFNDLSKFKK